MEAKNLDQGSVSDLPVLAEIFDVPHSHFSRLCFFGPGLLASSLGPLSNTAFQAFMRLFLADSAPSR